ncbi:Kunitz/Bovine pancreatic trypsin inhibitor domain protein [Necator americanus]|uniref:Kunitz/Bovine pancreatic trypsin inhibitor domain protein n=1 Tax=Necator americanus TaxID=51031 RepID=W2SPA1_NECAM|nr:Kunitz/Bovine pancreatic trypsin inhibitor domain protein [Necator americanus]ETN70696.1 Kunitz/Bovine pancreatic trypsin inhibitor domain protein [Necator americanus]
MQTRQSKLRNAQRSRVRRRGRRQCLLEAKSRVARARPPNMQPRLYLIQLCCCILTVLAKLECDPYSGAKKADPTNPESYLYCNLEGTYSKRKCLQGKVFNAESGQCESLRSSDHANDDPFSQPFFQAPDDLCGSGIPLTILSAPVVCNPSISSCPDGYVCRVYERTGTSYCCQGSSPQIDKAMCAQGQVTYLEPSGRPRSCVLPSSSSCPTGFSCTLVGGTATRCCGKDLGCPFNSAAFLNPRTSSHVECSPSQKTSCQNGYSCVRSTSLQKFICCSSSSSDSGTCLDGATPLSNPSSCSASQPCPSGYSCRDGKCCPGLAVCPAGSPLGGGPTACSEDNPCKDGYECVTTGAYQYCCPSRENVCSLPRNAGVVCASTRSAITRYYFDVTTGSCRSFQFSQCGGNANNFNTLEECEGFCLDAQCQHGQAYRVGAVNAVCALTAMDTCPRSHSCMSPVFGPSAVCCPTPDVTCNEMVSAGTPCFGRAVTIQRFYFNPNTRKCQAFQYYGCNGNGNNFQSMESCHDHCLNAADTVCAGAAALMDPNQQPQRCSSNVPCPSGYVCNPERYCCPTADTACSAVMSRGNVCSGSPLRTMWYYDQSQRKCTQFAYNGCGGTANRFTSKKACNSVCVSSPLSGSCPRGMSPLIEDGETIVKTCTLNVIGTCPLTASCVRSTTNQPICCQTVTSCPDNRKPYVIPGSTSVVACNIDADECPTGNACVESSSVPGFHMCCSTTITGNRRSSAGFGSTRKEPDTLAALIRSISPCPAQLTTNGHTCTVNAVGDCPRNYLCFRNAGYEHGSCCRTGPPKCSMKQYVPVFVSGTQVQICQNDLGGCPRDSRCMTSTIPTVSICCQLYQPQLKSRGNEMNGVMARPLAQPKCRNGDRPFNGGGVVFECSFTPDNCPPGYKCEFSSTGQAVCCGDPETIRCPFGSNAFEYGGRPLACPAGSTKCPHGYACVASLNPQYHLCCSSAVPVSRPPPGCLTGTPFVDPGYCPPNQVPYVGREGYPPTCHMQLNPCPTTAPFVCIYSAMKQDSYCCTPMDAAGTAFTLPDPSVAASPMKRIGLGDKVPMSAPSNPYGGMTQTFPGGPVPVPPTMPPIGIADPIPGVNPEQILPPGLSTNLHTAGNPNNLNFNNNPSGAFPNQNVNGYPNNQLVGGLPGYPRSQPPTIMPGFPNNQQSGVMIGGRTDLHSQVIQDVLSQYTHGNRYVGGGNPYFATPNNNAGQWTIPQNSVTGCPFGSRALVRADRSVVMCAEQPCPNGFVCVFAERCCSSSPILASSIRPDSSSSTQSSIPDVTTGDPIVECPPGFFLIEGKCLKVLFAGQKGCLSDEQCAAREPNATCDSGYCVCPAAKPLVHGGKCVAGCPEGFANIAGRCYDPTTVIFMDSVDERKNGTIGGYCLDTVVEEKRCEVGNSYCSEKTITCQCKVGYILKMDFKDKEDKGSCQQDESSKFKEPEQQTMPVIDEELYFVDIGSNISDAEPEQATNSTADDDVDLSKYLFQTDELVSSFA